MTLYVGSAPTYIEVSCLQSSFTRVCVAFLLIGIYPIKGTISWFQSSPCLCSLKSICINNESFLWDMEVQPVWIDRPLLVGSRQVWAWNYFISGWIVICQGTTQDVGFTLGITFHTSTRVRPSHILLVWYMWCTPLTSSIVCCLWVKGEIWFTCQMKGRFLMFLVYIWAKLSPYIGFLIAKLF